MVAHRGSGVSGAVRPECASTRGRSGAAARILACDAGEKGVCCFNHGGLKFRHGPRGSKARPFMGCREQTLVPDALGACGKHLAPEAPDELADRQCHCTSVPGAPVSHPDLYLTVRAAEDAFVRDGDPVGVKRQVVQHLGRPTGGLGMDHPVLSQGHITYLPSAPPPTQITSHNTNPPRTRRPVVV